MDHLKIMNAYDRVCQVSVYHYAMGGYHKIRYPLEGYHVGGYSVRRYLGGGYLGI